MNSTVNKVTERIRRRSAASRDAYLSRIRQAAEGGPNRTALSCSNLAHGMAACGTSEKQGLSADRVANIGIVSANNDMLSAHQPFLSNKEKARVREVFAEAKIDRTDLLAAESAAYHAPGTSTFYGTAAADCRQSFYRDCEAGNRGGSTRRMRTKDYA